MYVGRTAACEKHLTKAVRDVLGKDKAKDMKVHNVTAERGTYFCYCGKGADFYVAAIEKKPKPTAPVRRRA